MSGGGGLRHPARSHRVILIALALMLGASGTAPVAHADPPALWSGLEPGAFAVGYRRLDGPRCAVDVWYPARLGGARMRYVDLLADSAGVTTFLASAHVPADEVKRLFGLPLAARRSAPAIAARSPLVLVGQGNGQSTADQVVLCEYLASHGYVVASTPSPTLRAALEREDQMGTFAEMQCGDLTSAIPIVAAALPVDTTRIGVVGHSFGARGALLLAMRDPRVRALVSLDGGIGTATGDSSFRSAPSFRAAAPLLPILHFYETLDPWMAPDFALLEGVHAKSLVLQEVHEMHHVHFTTAGFVAAVFPGFATATHATVGTGESVRGVATRTLAFLDTALQDERR
jgi:dienelactone hydrolase